jgi:hypothetical protein
MAEFAMFYAGMAVVTALFLFADVGPRSAGEWLGLFGIAVAWPAAFAYALYCAVTRAA